MRICSEACPARRVGATRTGSAPGEPDLFSGAVVYTGKTFVRLRSLRCLGALALLLAVLACSPPPPVRIGFIGGLSGRVADLGVEGRNGVALAVELRNKAGGVNGRPVELIAEDDQQDPDQARRAAIRLIGLEVEAIVGPMTSTMATAVLPLANEARLVMVAPTVSSKAFSGIDDYLFRVVASTDVHARANAAYHYNKLGLRRVAAAYDLNNKVYSEIWLAEYNAEFARLGGEVVSRVTFASGPDVRFTDLADQLLAGKPDGVLIIANSVDAAMFCQHVRRKDSRVQIATSEWAATEQLIELGGRAVEGIIIAQLLDRQGTQKAFVDFRSSYSARYGKVPGFPGLTAFDAANVVLDALSVQPSGQTLKQTLLARKTFAGAQGALTFDAYGDTWRPTYLTTVREGAFVRLQ